MSSTSSNSIKPVPVSTSAQNKSQPQKNSQSQKTAAKSVKMQSWLEFLSTPTAEGTGTVLVLHTGEKNYVLGQLSEGTFRMVQSGNATFRNVSDILVSGRLGWNNMGGLCGIALLLAEIKAGTLARLKEAKPEVEHKVENIKVFGPSNLTYALSTMRRFIFRTGVPLDIQEPTPSSFEGQKEPTWSDDKIQVWSMPIIPEGERPPSQKKRSYSELQQEDTTPGKDVYKSIVKDMFASNWSARQLVSAKLPEVKMPAAIFVRNPESGNIDHYAGPLPGGDEPVPDIEVLVRLPWPGARIQDIDPVQPSPDAMSYIITHHAQRGKFLAHKAKEYKVPPGPLYTVLTNGSPVENTDGEQITPEMVMEPGRPGRGIAVLDIPSPEYIQPLRSRPEWANSDLIQSLQAIVWILGKGVKDDERIKKFQQSLPNTQHIISSSDSCPDSFSFKQAVEVAWLRSYVDPTVFPEINIRSHGDTFPPSAVDIPEESRRDSAIRAQPGLRIHLEPRPKLATDLIEQPLDIPKLQRAVKADADRIGINNVQREVSQSQQVEKAKTWSDAIPNNDAEIITLGTGSGNPGLLRNVSGTLVRVPGQGTYLLDCGEGTLGTLRRLFSPEELESIMRDLKMIWISHLHADHHLGITSVIREWSRTCYGDMSPGEIPKDAPRLAVVSHIHMQQWLEEFSCVDDMGFSKIIPLMALPTKETRAVFRVYTPKGVPLDDGTGQHTTQKYLDMMNLSDLNSVYVNHCYGAMAMTATTKSGFKFSYSGDCRPNHNFTKIGKDSHVLIHEATFEDNMYGEARAKKHSTAGEALVVADRMNAQGLILTHMSQRYYHSSSLTYSLRGQKLASNGNTANGNGILNVEASPEAGADVGVEPTAITADSPDHALEVNRILEKDQIKVVSAYDYMRITVKDMPRIQTLQPVIDVFNDNWDHLTSQGKEPAEDSVQLAGDGGIE